MSMKSQSKVGRLASSLVAVAPGPVALPRDLPGGLAQDYLDFLAATNGGYTADYLFHFFGASGSREHDVVRWNLPETWKEGFGLDGYSFVFAEDILGNQYYFHLGSRRKVTKVFCIDDGTSLPCADDLPGFVDNVVNSPAVTSEPRRLFEAFRKSSGLDYPLFHHLSNKIPACLGGDDTDLANLEFSNSIVHLDFMGQVVNQVKSLPAGTVIRNVTIDPITSKLRLLT